MIAQFADPAVFAFAAWHFGFSVAGMGALVFVAALIALTAIDFDTQLLPDNMTLPQLCSLLACSALCIGNDSGVYNGSFFDLGPEGEVEIGNYCTLVGAIICSNRRIVIHDYVFIAHEVTLADNAFGVPFAATSTAAIEARTKIVGS